MALNINEFRSKITSGGVLKSSNYMVDITTPPWASTSDVEFLRFYCDSAQLPGIALATAENRRLGYSTIEYTPMSAIYTDLQLDFFVDQSGKILKFFHDWIGNTISLPGKNAENVSQKNSAYAYEVFYKDKYATTINIIHYNRQGKEAIRYTINEAFPVIIGDISVSWANQDQLLRLPVVFKFKNWTSEVFDVANYKTGFDGWLGQPNVSDNRYSLSNYQPTQIQQFVDRPLELQDIFTSIRLTTKSISTINSLRNYQ